MRCRILGLEGYEIRNLVLVLVSLRLMLDIQKELSCKQLSV